MGLTDIICFLAMLCDDQQPLQSIMNQGDAQIRYTSSSELNDGFEQENTIKEICILYLRKYVEKDLEAVSDLFAENITLRDWKIYVEGKENAISETKKNFESAGTIEIEILATHQSENTVAAELKIVVDSSEVLFVVDVITLNEKGKITSIRAYLGRGDD